MKLSTVLVSAVFGVILGTVTSFASASEAPTVRAAEAHSASHGVTTYSKVGYPTSSVKASHAVMSVPAQHVTQATSAVQPSALRWTCGDFHPTALGTMVRDCEWQ